MTRSGAAPSAALLVYGGVTASAFAASSPVVLLGCLAVAIYGIRLAPVPRRLFMAAAFGTGIAIAVVNPLVTRQGDLVLIDGPQTAILNFKITLEQLVYGAASGVRVASVTLLCGAFLGSVDRDRLLAAASRIVPRSALTVALAARLLPVLRRDAATITETARLRGLEPGLGRSGRRAAAVLVTPLVASALERGLDRAEAMTARGYGTRGRSRLPESGLTMAERMALATATVVWLAALAAATSAASFRYYPTLGTLNAASLLLAGVVAVAGAAGIRLVAARS